MSIDHNASPMLRFIEDYPAGDLFGFVFVRVLGLSFRFFFCVSLDISLRVLLVCFDWFCFLSITRQETG